MESHLFKYFFLFTGILLCEGAWTLAKPDARTQANVPLETAGILLEAALSSEETDHFLMEVKRYLKGIFVLKGHFSQRTLTKTKRKAKTPPQEKIQEGTFYFLRSEDGLYKIRVDLSDQKMLLVQNCLHLIHLKTNVVSKYSMESTPIAFIFSQNIDLKKKFPVHFVVYDELKRVMSVTLKTSSKSSQYIVLHFSLYRKNKNIQNLAGWSIKDASGNVTHVFFDEQTLKANNRSMIENECFDLPTTANKK